MAIGHMFLSLVQGPINLVEPPGKLMVEQKVKTPYEFPNKTIHVPEINHQNT